MKHQMNFTTSYDDVIRFTSAEDLHRFYTEHGCDGLELMPLPYSTAEAPDVCLPPKKCPLIVPGMVTGIHCCCIGDWMGRNREEMVQHYRKDLDYAMRVGAEYVVFHVVQVDDEEGFTYERKHTDLELRTQEEAVEALHRMLDRQEDMIPYIKGIHLQQSLTGYYVKEWLQTPHELPEDPTERFCKVYEHIFRIDKHEPFTAAGVKGLVERIEPMYVTYEYITRNREELAEYLERGRIA